MKKIVLILIILINTVSVAQTKYDGFDESKQHINTVLEKWHKAASEASFDTYFSLMTDDAIFIGTDATENWDISSFKKFSKPYFDRGKAWSFTTLERNIFIQSKNNITNLAWFDELLDTQMGICRGSGVLEKTPQGWKIKHYVLSIAIPNENVKEVTTLKASFDTLLMDKLRNNQN